MDNEEFAQALVAIGGAVLVGFAVAKLFDKRRAPASMSFGRSSFGYDPRVREYDVIGGDELDLMEPWEQPGRGRMWGGSDPALVGLFDDAMIDDAPPTLRSRASDLLDEYGPTAKEYGSRAAKASWKGAKWGGKKAWEGSKKVYGYAKSKAPGAWQYTKESAGWAGKAGRSAYEAGRALDWEVPFKQRSSYRPVAPTLIDMPAPKTLVMDEPPPEALRSPRNTLLWGTPAKPNRRRRRRRSW